MATGGDLDRIITAISLRSLFYASVAPCDTAVWVSTSGRQHGAKHCILAYRLELPAAMLRRNDERHVGIYLITCLYAGQNLFQ